MVHVRRKEKVEEENSPGPGPCFSQGFQPSRVRFNVLTLQATDPYFDTWCHQSILHHEVGQLPGEEKKHGEGSSFTHQEVTLPETNSKSS